MAKSFMQKQAVISTLAAKTGLTQVDVTKFLEAYNELIAQELVTNGGINIPDMGRAKAVTRAAVAERQSINPRTREPMVIPAVPEHTVYQVKFGKDFLTRVGAIQKA